MMRTDLGLHAVVSAALRARLGSAAAHISVVARDGVVTLSGAVATHADKVVAEQTVQRVPGVHAVAEELHVATNLASAMTDETLARAALGALATGTYPIGREVRIRVENGWLSLTGRVASPTEYLAVERALECMPGLRGTTNEVRVQNPGAARPGGAVAPDSI